MASSSKHLTYEPTYTGNLFHRCFSNIKGVRGCVGSGKSVMCVMDMFFKSNTMPADPYDHVRRSKWLIIRSTYRMLTDTTIPTLLAWFPMIKMRWGQTLDGSLKLPCIRNDGTTVDIQYKFLALDKPNDIEKLKSYEVSGVWVNEAGAIPWKFIAMAYQRTGRYPKKDTENGITYPGLGMILDTNPPTDTSWWYELAEIKKPKGISFFCQPPALLKREGKGGEIYYEPNKGQDEGIPKAENVENQNEGYDYWLKQTISGDHNWIKVYVLGQYGVEVQGDPVYPEYNDQLHYAGKELQQIPNLPVFLGTDFGRTPATVICQITAFGQLRILDEICTKNMGVTQFTDEVLLPKLMNEYRMHQVGVFNFADPAGNDKGQTDEQTCIEIMRNHGVNTVASPVLKNGFVRRRESVAMRLKRTCDGQPGLLLSSKCKMLRSGFQGRYYYRKVNAADYGDEKIANSPEKNIFSHIQDALQYVSCGLDSPSSASLFDGYTETRWAGGIFSGGHTATSAREIDTKLDMRGFY